MAVKLFFLLVVLEVTSSMTPPQTSSGKHFVFAFPIATIDGRRKPSDSAWLRFNTEERTASLVMSFPKNPKGYNKQKPQYRHHYCRAWRRIGCTFKFHSKELGPTSTGIFLAGKVKADAPVSGVVYARTSLGEGSSIVRLLPQEICSTSYYVSTTNGGFPFIMLMTFDHTVKARILFPKYEKYFKVFCKGNRYCSSDTLVSFNFAPFTVWQLYIKEQGVCFHNTLIKADHPVYVIAGNTAMRDRSDNLDTGAFSLRPTETWGKEYILPRFGDDKHRYSKRMAYYRINSRNIPFMYTSFQNGRKTIKRVSDNDYDEIIDAITSPVVISADVPFGLYQYILGGDGLELGFLNVVPTEQWRSGGLFFLSEERYSRDLKLKYQNIRYFVFTTSEMRPFVVKRNGRIDWISSIRYPGRAYNFGKLMVSSFPILVYSIQPNGRLVIYKQVISTKGNSMAYYSTSSYFANIYETGCIKTDPLFSDGVDNDCDGFVDEEWNNRRDDDGDGAIDEDYMETPGYPEWTAWTTVCDVLCSDTYPASTYKEKIRDCKRYVEKERTCKGHDQMLRTEGKLGTSCQKGIAYECACPSKCRTCLSPSSHRCHECKDGYYGSHCLIPCPHGWRGNNCTLPPRPEDLRFLGTAARLENESKGRRETKRAREEREERERVVRERSETEKKNEATKESVFWLVAEHVQLRKDKLEQKRKRAMHPLKGDKKETRFWSSSAWHWIIIIVFVVLVFCIVLLIILFRRKRSTKKDEDENKEPAVEVEEPDVVEVEAESSKAVRESEV